MAGAGQSPSLRAAPGAAAGLPPRRQHGGGGRLRDRAAGGAGCGLRAPGGRNTARSGPRPCSLGAPLAYFLLHLLLLLPARRGTNPSLSPPRGLLKKLSLKEGAETPRPARGSPPRLRSRTRTRTRNGPARPRALTQPRGVRAEADARHRRPVASQGTEQHRVLLGDKGRTVSRRYPPPPLTAAPRPPPPAAGLFLTSAEAMGAAGPPPPPGLPSAAGSSPASLGPPIAGRGGAAPRQRGRAGARLHQRLRGGAHAGGGGQGGGWRPGDGAQGRGFGRPEGAPCSVRVLPP